MIPFWKNPDGEINKKTRFRPAKTGFLAVRILFEFAPDLPHDARVNVELKHKLWDIIRPFHSPLTRNLRRRLGRNYQDHPEMELPPPYDAIQLDVERHLHDYLHLSPDEISQIIIVGANRAEEIGRLRRLYSRVLFLCFEPNPSDHQFLAKKFGQDAQVSISNLALSDAPGKARFY
jgi:hypothetical protein